ncbi:MAG: FecR domain-containing protein [Candidatus Rokubacteria bacterium]|nr:FecR domain-containing protein [Candidatus Rokubacteria bacterium]
MGTVLIRGLLASALLLTFVFPARAQDGKGIGVVTALTGRADLKRPQAPETPLRLRDNLFVRDVVDTQKESLARFLLMGKATVTVREFSRFEIREETRPDGSQRGLINLAEGKIRVGVARRLMRPGDEVEIRTPNAIAAVRGSDGVIEVSKLPDGRPQTVITGASGEFQLTLPTTPPFIANGKEFQDGPALAGEAPGILLAMAETASDAGPGVRVAQGLGLSVSALVQAQITGFAGAQALAQALLSQTQVNQLIGNYQLNVGATGANQPPPAANDKVVNTGTAAAATATLASGAQPGLGGGTVPGFGGGGGVFTPPITPLTPATNSRLVNQVSNGGGNGTATTPFHIQVTWGTAVPDLDLHLTGPQNSRFHVYFSDKGSLTRQPFAKLHRDCVCSGGSEVITVQQFNQGGVYRASVFNFGNQSSTSTSLSTAAEAEIKVIRGGSVVARPATGETGGTGSIVSGGTTVATLRPTAGQAGNTWRAVEINPANGQITAVNQILNSSSSSSVQ